MKTGTALLFGGTSFGPTGSVLHSIPKRKAVASGTTVLTFRHADKRGEVPEIVQYWQAQLERHNIPCNGDPCNGAPGGLALPQRGLTVEGVEAWVDGCKAAVNEKVEQENLRKKGVALPPIVGCKVRATLGSYHSDGVRLPLVPGDEIRLCREEDNAKDPNAIRAHLKQGSGGTERWVQCGYLNWASARALRGRQLKCARILTQGDGYSVPVLVEVEESSSTRPQTP